MSRLLFDTTFLVDAERGEVALDDVVGDDDDVALAAITVAELSAGVRLSTGRAQRHRQSYLDDIMESIPILTYDASVALAHAELLVAVRKSGRPRGAHDLIIAATARASKRTVLTADERGFTDLPGVTVTPHR